MSVIDYEDDQRLALYTPAIPLPIFIAQICVGIALWAAMFYLGWNAL